MTPREPWVRHEDDDVLVVDKPAGVATHRADEHAQEGMHEWVGRRRPESKLSVLHRLDKATSGLLVFGKTADANRLVGAQFADRSVAKRYELVVAGGRGEDTLRCDEPVPSPARRHEELSASTTFRHEADGRAVQRWTAVPHTGRTHQVRRHAQALGLPIVGDDRYGGPDACRLLLHSAELGFDAPEGRVDADSPRPAVFDAVVDGVDPTAADVAASVALAARTVLFDAADTNAFVWIDRAHDGFPGVRVERLGSVAVVVDRRDDATVDRDLVAALHDASPLDGVFWLRRSRHGDHDAAERVSGAASTAFTVTEDGACFAIDLAASATSTGLFLDQRETRHTLRGLDLAGKTVLNTFAHTGTLSVAAAQAGAETLTFDLSKHYLDRARTNFAHNDLDPADHDFMYGDAIEWMDRFAKKQRLFDVVLADPPSTSTPRSKRGRRWVAARDLWSLVGRSARLCRPGGLVYVSTNLRKMDWSQFIDHVDRGLADAGRSASITTTTVPIDFRTGPGDPGHLKGAWLALDE